MRSQALDAELASLLHRTFQRACAKSVELLDEWPCHPGNVLATHMADRLETPHEVPMTMEQYEEVSKDWFILRIYGFVKQFRTIR